MLYRRWRGRTGIGGGDPKMFGAIGAWLGWTVLPQVLLGACLTGLAIVAGLALAGRPVRPHDAPAVRCAAGAGRVGAVADRMSGRTQPGGHRPRRRRPLAAGPRRCRGGGLVALAFVPLALAVAGAGGRRGSRARVRRASPPKLAPASPRPPPCGRRRGVRATLAPRLRAADADRPRRTPRHRAARRRPRRRPRRRSRSGPAADDRDRRSRRHRPRPRRRSPPRAAAAHGAGPPPAARASPSIFGVPR
ncbi:MAG: A24 family peptidase [Sphingomonas fennica]